MELIKPFGPEIGYAQLSDEHNSLLLDICEKYKNDSSRRVNNNLVGFIDCEFNILDLVRPTLLPVITKMILEYANNAESLYTMQVNVTDVNCISGWCNIQKTKEFNPVHNHPLHDIACVIFPKVEMSKTKVYKAIPGCLGFKYGERLNNFGTPIYHISPKTKDVYIFPADMFHYTTPVWEDTDIRISTSFNFIFNDLFRARVTRG
jgi:Putative 2OG-Fe(II) oxygenase